MYFSFSMDYIKILLVIFAFISLNDAVKVNMQGSLSFGKEVVDTLSHYMRRNAGNVVARRRSIPFSKETDVIYIIIKSAYLCRDLDFCEGELEQFLNEYIMVQTKSIEAIFEGIVNQNQLLDQDAKTEQRLVFEEDLKKCLREIRRVLRQANMKMRDESITYLWIEVIKKISVMFQTAAILFAAERLEGRSDEIMEVKKKLTQKLVIATTIVEGKYESKLCSEYDICIKAYEVTKALNTLLGALRDMEEENVKIFIRYVSEALLETNLYSHLSEVTSNELQIILNDMAYSENVSAKTVLMSIQKAVEDRLNALNLKTHMVNGRDVELVHVILSDMDHVYGKSSIDPFHVFMSSFFTWERTKSRLSGPIRSLLKELTNEINGLPDDLGFKLINEVRAFLEITVDPEN